jgi:hypothetical protein
VTSVDADNARADRVAAVATAIGIGLITFMVAWTVGVRITERMWGPPSSALVAMAAAVVVGVTVTLRAARRLVHDESS